MAHSIAVNRDWKYAYWSGTAIQPSLAVACARLLREFVCCPMILITADHTRERHHELRLRARDSYIEKLSVCCLGLIKAVRSNLL